MISVWISDFKCLNEICENGLRTLAKSPEKVNEVCLDTGFVNEFQMHCTVHFAGTNLFDFLVFEYIQQFV